MIDLAPQLSLLEARAQALEVHGLRVAALRINVWLELCGHSALRSDLRWLRLSAREARDLEVLEKRAWVKISAAELQHARSTLSAALASARFSGLLRALASLPPLEPRRAQRALPRMLTRLRRAADDALKAPNDEAARHRLRRRARRLRYACEWLGRPANEWIAIQEELGRSNDAAVALERARRQHVGDATLLAALTQEARGTPVRLRELWEQVERSLEEEA